MTPAMAVCWGAGWDSTAMLIEMERRGEFPAMITFADTGGEKPGTYEFIPVFIEWLLDHGYPEPAICTYKPKEETSQRYRQAVIAVAERLGITLGETQLARLSMLFGNMAANETLPGIAFGPKTCSIKWKLEAQEPT